MIATRLSLFFAVAAGPAGLAAATATSSTWPVWAALLAAYLSAPSAAAAVVALAIAAAAAVPVAGAAELTALAVAVAALTVARLRAEARERQAATDPLTGLANRRALDERRRPAIRQVVLYGDLAGFKDVNDTLGHAAGDRLLQQVAGALGAAVRDDDLVVRLGGDEFAVIGTAAGDVDGLIARVRKAADAVLEPHGSAFNLGVSYLEAGAPLDAALAEADAAMYAAKAEHRRQATRPAA